MVCLGNIGVLRGAAGLLVIDWSYPAAHYLVEPSVKAPQRRSGVRRAHRLGCRASEHYYHRDFMRPLLQSSPVHAITLLPLFLPFLPLLLLSFRRRILRPFLVFFGTTKTNSVV